MDNAHQFSSQLKHLRKSRQWTLSKIALASGLSKSTLHAWESGLYTPRPAELKLYLEKLEPNPDEKVRLLKLLDVPRAMIVLGVDKTDRPPLAGDILRGLRLRQGKTQAEVALHLGVRQAMLAKWEHSEDWPSAERLHHLCFFLNATPQEAEAILSGVFLPEQPEELEVGDAIESIKTKLDAFTGDRYLDTSDLWFLSLESQVWWLAQKSDRARDLQYSIWFLHANYLLNEGRWDEASLYLQRIFNEQQRQTAASTTMMMTIPQQSAFILQAKILWNKGNDSKKNLSKANNALRFLERQEAMMTHPECQAWYWMELAYYLSILSRNEEALLCCTRSNTIPHEKGNRLEDTAAKLATAEVALKIQQWDHAHTLLDEIVPLHVAEELSALITRIETFLGAKEYSAAYTTFQQFIKTGQAITPVPLFVNRHIERLTPIFA
jgi:transcriptional regulator with XRE-family HTH domain